MGSDLENAMTSAAAKACSKILSDVEAMMDSVDVARLTEGQYEEIKRLKAELEEFCAAADRENAENTERRIVAIIKEGPPGYG